MVSTSSSTVRATIVELDHCGTQASVRARSGAASEAGGTASGSTVVPPSRPPAAAIGGRTPTASGSVGSRNPARACSTVDLPDPLGPTSAVRVPGAATSGSSSTAARRVRAVPSTNRVVRSTTNGEAARNMAAGDSTLLSSGAAASNPSTLLSSGAAASNPSTLLTPGAAVSSPATLLSSVAAVSRRRAEPFRGDHRGATRAGSTASGSGGPAPGTQMPIASRRSRSLSRVERTGPSATTRPSSESTTSRSTRSTHGPSTCSTTTSVGEGCPAVSAATASRTSRAELGSSIAVGSSSSTTDGSSAKVPASARRWVCPPDSVPVGVSSARSPRPTEPSADATTPAMAPRGIRTFSGPNATSRPTEAATTPAPGSCSTSPTAPGRFPGATPSTVTVPVSSPASTVSSSPASARSRVDLPDPDGPTSSTRSPGRRVSEMSRSTGSRRPNGRQVRSLDLDQPGRGAPPRRARPVTRARHPARRRQTAWCSRCSCPAGKADRAPARASARTSTHPTSPASTAPETAIAPR